MADEDLEINTEDQPTDEEVQAFLNDIHAAAFPVAPEVEEELIEEAEVNYPAPQAPLPNEEPKILVGHPDTGGFQWIPEAALDETWAELGWLRAAVGPDNEAHIVGQAEEQGAETADAQTTEQVES